jgi:secreted trypsin-like serine protease
VSGGGENCASTKHPDLYTDVAYYKEWIERHLIMSKGELGFDFSPSIAGLYSR